MLEDQDFGLVAGRYRLRDKLGHGGMGRVWLAHDEMLGRDVAIKEVSPPPHVITVDNDHLRAVLLREAKAAGRINHPNVVKIHDVIETEGWPWLVMEYVPSIDMQASVDERGPLPPADVARIGLALLEALVAAHAAGVLHRDVKPANVLLCDDGRVVLGDFGLASLDPDGKVSLAAGLGTPQFLAPERARHGISSREADFWSLGATLYAAVEGRSPYARPTMMETFSALAESDADPMQLAGPLAPVLAGLLARDPAQRTSPEQLRRQLFRVMAGQTVAMPALAKPARTARRTLAVLVGVGAVGALAAAGVVFGPEVRDGWTPVGEVPTGRPAAAIGIPGCEAQRVEASPLPQTRPASATGLPEDWVLYTDPTGFSTVVPRHWRFWRLANNTVCFKDPGGSGVLGVMPFRPKAEALQDYREISQKEVSWKRPATEWEFTYQLRDRKRHAIALVTPGPTIFWITDDADFATGHARYDLVRAWFEAGDFTGQPVPGPLRSQKSSLNRR